MQLHYIQISYTYYKGGVFHHPWHLFIISRNHYISMLDKYIISRIWLFVCMRYECRYVQISLKIQKLTLCVRQHMPYSPILANTWPLYALYSSLSALICFIVYAYLLFHKLQLLYIYYTATVYLQLSNKLTHLFAMILIEIHEFITVLGKN